jgi:hypothetical protein
MSQQELSREVQEIWALFREVAKRQEEAGNQIREVAKRQEETDREIKETAKEIKLLSDNVNALTGKWGRFVEGLVAPGAVRMFRERGIEVNQTLTRIEAYKDGEKMEIDILLVNELRIANYELRITPRLKAGAS